MRLLPDPDPDVYEAKWRAAQHHTDIVITQRKDRTLRACVFFYGSLAQKHGVRLSALVAHIIGWLRVRRKADPNAYEYDPCEKFGTALGVSKWQVYRLLKQAKAAGLLDYSRSLRQTQIWVADDSLYDLDSSDRFEYDRDLADKYGLNASILYAKIYYHTAHPEAGKPPGYRADYARFVKKFPWMTEAGVKADLIRLRKKKLIKWHNENCHFTSHCYEATRVHKAPEQEGMMDTLRRAIGLKSDLTPLDCAASQGRKVRGHRSGSPESGKGSGKPCCSPGEEQDADGL